MKIIVSSGGTREAIDSVRFISNVSTGSTGAALAEALAQHGHEIVQLRGQGSVVAEDVAESKSFSSAQDLWELLRQELGTGTIDAVIMCAAVADYRPEAETPGKIRSDAEQLVLRLVRNPKLLPQLKACSPKPLKVVGFKFTVGEEATQGLSAVQRQWTAGGVDAVVQNDLREIQASKVHPFWFYKDPAQAPERILGARALAAKLDEFLVGKKERPKPETARPKLKSSLRCLLFNIGNTTLLG